MLARHDGRIVFVRGVIPGERVSARIVRRAKGVAWAEVVEILDASPDRRATTADPSCGGASFAHIAPARQLTLKAEIIADAFRRIGKHPLAEVPAVRPSPERGYRLRARLHVRDRRVGFFRDGTHTLCDAAPSGQLRDDTLAAVGGLVETLGSAADAIDALTVAENVAARSRVVHLEPRPGTALDGLEAAAALTDGVSGLTISTANGRFVSLAGAPTVTDTALDLLGADPPIDAGVAWTRHATSFFQANRYLTGAVVRKVLAELADVADGVIADCYAGVGLFAVAIAARGSRVVAIEGDRWSGADLAVNAQPFADRLTVVTSSVEQTLAAPAPDGLAAVVVDPPRTGMSPDALRGAVAWRPRRLVYVSCDPPTLARDAAVLFAAGYTLVRIEAFDLFPNTPHVETVAVFDRNSNP
jgi:23S rRNA (uracil1939-C5)-methyltransferase